MTLTISPFWAGVLATVAFEIVALIVAAVVMYVRKK